MGMGVGAVRGTLSWAQVLTLGLCGLTAGWELDGVRTGVSILVSHLGILCGPGSSLNTGLSFHHVPVMALSQPLVFQTWAAEVGWEMEELWWPSYREGTVTLPAPYRSWCECLPVRT